MALSQKTTASLNPEAGRSGEQDLASLVHSVAAGDDSAFAVLYDATSGLLFGLLLLAFGDTETTETVLSEVYVEVRQQAARFDTRREILLTWLVTIAHRLALEQLHSDKSVQPLADSVGPAYQHSFASFTKADVSESEHRRLICSALDSFSPSQHKVIELAYFYEMSAREIAVSLGLPLETVESELQHGILKLYGLFKGTNLFGAANAH